MSPWTLATWVVVVAIGWVVLLLLVSISWSIYKTIKEPHPNKALKHYTELSPGVIEDLLTADSRAVKNYFEKQRNTYGR